MAAREARVEAPGSVPTEAFIWALGSLCRLHQLPFDPELVLKQFPPPYDLPTLLRRFLHARQPTKVKLASFQFRKYGMLEGMVAQVSADATEAPNPNTRSGGLAGRDRPAPGMQVMAEIYLGERTVLEYLLSPVQKAFHEAGRER